MLISWTSPGPFPVCRLSFLLKDSQQGYFLAYPVLLLPHLGTICSFLVSPFRFALWEFFFDKSALKFPNQLDSVTLNGMHAISLEKRVTTSIEAKPQITNPEAV